MKRTWPLLLALVAFLGMFGFTLYKVLSVLGGEFAYALDDPYIHMATAKNFAAHGTWGVSPDEFASATSSILWPMLLAGVFKVAGPLDWAALVLNVLLALGCVAVGWKLVSERAEALWLRAVVLIGFVFGAPLVLLSFIGMEHMLHIFLVLAFLWFLGREEDAKAKWWLVALALLLTATRFEAGFMVFGAAVLRPKQWKLGLLMLAAAILPVVVYGLLSTHNGAMFLPNSVVLKGNANRDLVQLVLRPFLDTANGRIGLAALIVAAIAAFMASGNDRVVAGTVAITTYLHLALAQQGWLFRYEAYLVSMAILVSFPILFRKDGLVRKNALYGAVGIACVLVFGIMLVLRAIRTQESAVIACRNIHDQQVQMAKFVRQNYNGGRVALNDIGAVSYYADIHCVDLVGLANATIARAKKDGSFGSQTLLEVTSHPPIDLAICYPEIFTPQEEMPPSWIDVGRLTISDNLVCWKPSVTFFAPSASAAPALKQRLELFRKQLPPGDDLSF